MDVNEHKKMNESHFSSSVFKRYKSIKPAVLFFTSDL